MVNTLDAVVPKILGLGLLALRKRAVMPRLVNGDYAADAAKKGDIINVPIPKAQVAAAITPSNTPPAPASVTPGSVPIPLDQWVGTDFHLNDKEMQEIMARDNFLPGQTSEAFEALATNMNAFIMAKTEEFAGAVGLTGETVDRPFSSPAAATISIAELIRVMGENRVPLSQRRLVVDPINEGDATVLDWFRAADQAGTDAVIRDAVIGHRMGFDWAMDQQAGTAFTTGNGTVASVNNTGGYPAGTTELTIAVTNDIKVGDTISFAGHGATYAVAIERSGAGTLTLSGRGLRDAVADTEVISIVDVGATAVTRIPAFHRDAIAFVNRPITLDSEANSASSNLIRQVTDPVTGLSIRLEVSRQYKQTVWELDVLYGAACVIPEYGVKIHYA